MNQWLINVLTGELNIFLPSWSYQRPSGWSHDRLAPNTRQPTVPAPEPWSWGIEAKSGRSFLLYVYVCVSFGYQPLVPVVQAQGNFIDSMRMWHHHVEPILKNSRKISTFISPLSTDWWSECWYLVVHDGSQTHDTDMDIVLLTDKSGVLQCAATGQSVRTSDQGGAERSEGTCQTGEGLAGFTFLKSTPPDGVTRRPRSRGRRRGKTAVTVEIFNGTTPRRVNRRGVTSNLWLFSVKS